MFDLISRANWPVFANGQFVGFCTREQTVTMHDEAVLWTLPVSGKTPWEDPDGLSPMQETQFSARNMRGVNAVFISCDERYVEEVCRAYGVAPIHQEVDRLQKQVEFLEGRLSDAGWEMDALRGNLR